MVVLFSLFAGFTLAGSCVLDRGVVPPTGGMGGAGGSGGMGGFGGAGECTTLNDCPTPGPCDVWTCQQNTCVSTAKPQGTKVDVMGDCKDVFCGPGGMAMTTPTDDPPTSANECKPIVCSSGMPVETNAPEGQTCGMGGQLECDGMGTCAGCSVASDCGASNACVAFTCSAMVCSSLNTNEGMEVANPNPGDCQHTICQAGSMVDVANDSEMPLNQGGACDVTICAGGVPVVQPLSPDDPCPGGYCNMVGQCVECTQPQHCPTCEACAVGNCVQVPEGTPCGGTLYCDDMGGCTCTNPACAGAGGAGGGSSGGGGTGG